MAAPFMTLSSLLSVLASRSEARPSASASSPPPQILPTSSGLHWEPTSRSWIALPRQATLRQSNGEWHSLGKPTDNLVRTKLSSCAFKLLIRVDAASSPATFTRPCFWVISFLETDHEDRISHSRRSGCHLHHRLDQQLASRRSHHLQRFGRQRQMPHRQYEEEVRQECERRAVRTEREEQNRTARRSDSPGQPG